MKTFKMIRTYFSKQQIEIYIKCEFQIDAELMCKAYFTMHEGIKSIKLVYKNKTHMYLERTEF